MFVNKLFTISRHISKSKRCVNVKSLTDYFLTIFKSTLAEAIPDLY